MYFKNAKAEILATLVLVGHSHLQRTGASAKRRTCGVSLGLDSELSGRDGGEVSSDVSDASKEYGINCSSNFSPMHHA